MVAAWTFTDSQSQLLSFTTGTVTFSGLNIGSAFADRVVVFCHGHDGNGFGLTVTSVTLNGTPMTLGLYVPRDTAGDAIGLWTMGVPTGTTCTIVVTYNFAAANVAVAMVGVLSGAANQVNQSNGYPSGFLPDPQTFTSSVPVYDFGIGVVFVMDAPSTVPQAALWAPPTTLDFQTNDAVVSRFYGAAHTTIPGAWQPSVRGTGGGNGLGFAGCCMVLGAWQQTGLETFIPLGASCL